VQNPSDRFWKNFDYVWGVRGPIQDWTGGGDSKILMKEDLLPPTQHERKKVRESKELSTKGRREKKEK